MARELLHHRILSVEGFPVRTSEGVVEYVRIRSSDWVNAVAVTEDGMLVLVRQHRWGIDQPTLEVPGGAVDAGEDPAVAGARELLEESGYGGGLMTPLGWVWSNPALQDNRTWSFLFVGVRRLGEPHRGPGEEDLEVLLRPATELRALLAQGVIAHALAVVALQRVLLDYPEALCLPQP